MLEKKSTACFDCGLFLETLALFEFFSKVLRASWPVEENGGGYSPILSAMPAIYSGYHSQHSGAEYTQPIW